jgi:vitamin B12 transporter
MRHKFLILLGGLLLSKPLWAQEQAAEPDLKEDTFRIAIDDELAESIFTILVNGVRQPAYKSGQTVAVFDRDDIDAVQGADLTRLLERSPGVSVSRNGGPGNFTAVRVRGAEGEQLLVLIDGVRVADPAAPGGGYDFGNLLMGNLGKVELQRSSNSTIWGSQAVGGVLAVTTGSEEHFNGSAEYGANDSLYGTVATWFAAGPATVNLQAGEFRSDGFSAAAAGTEPDGFRQTELAGHAVLQLSSRLSAFVRGRYADGRVDLDGFPAPDFLLADTVEEQDSRQVSAAGGLHYQADALDLRATLSTADTERANFDSASATAPNFSTDGTSERAELRGRWRFARGLALNFGGEREWLRFSTLFDPVHRSALMGGYAQLDYDFGPLHVAGGVRRDEHRDFGGEWSLGADAAYELHGVRLTASYGEGFKAPTLFQLLSDYGNAALQPERSRSYDAGVGFGAGPAYFKLTAFRRDTRGLIGFVSCSGTATGICAGRPYGTYANIGLARAQGLELEGNVRVGYRLELGLAYTLLDAEDRTPGSATEGNALARRPKHALTATADWKPVDAVSLGADLRVVSGSFDDAFNAIRLDGYEVLTLRGAWDASEHVTLFGRIENVWDETYQTAAGYATPGRGAYIGARVRL